MTDRMNDTVAEPAELPVADLKAADYEGFIDAVEDGRIFGWALDPRAPSEKLMVELYHGRTLLDRVVADRYREDLVDYGDGSGRHAFVYTLPRELWTADPAEFYACYIGTRVPLLRGPRCSRLRLPGDLDLAVSGGGGGGDFAEPGEPANLDRPAASSGADLDALTARIESCERAVVALVHLVHPSSDHELSKSARVEQVSAALETLRGELATIEDFAVRHDGRLKKAETALNLLEHTRDLPWHRRLDVWGLILGTAALVLAGLILGFGAGG